MKNESFKVDVETIRQFLNNQADAGQSTWESSEALDRIEDYLIRKNVV